MGDSRNQLKVAITGRAGSGKTTCANYLVQNYGFVRLSFATKVKEFAEQITLRSVDKFDVKQRAFLQALGDGARQVDKQIWIKWLGFTLRHSEDGGQNIVIDDCRYSNEAEWLREYGFIIVKLTGRSYPLTPEMRNHPSERETEDIEADVTVDASQPLARVLESLDALLKAVVAKSSKKNEYMTFRKELLRFGKI